MTTTDTLRSSDLKTLVDVLKGQHARKHDVIVPAANLRLQDGMLMVQNAEPELTEEGVTTTYAPHRIGTVASGDLAARTDIPVTYWRRLAEHAVPLLDENANHWLARDTKDVLVRTFTNDDGGPGFTRAVLSNSYAMLDNLDAVMATLDGIRATGVKVEIRSADLTERNMHVRFFAPEIAVPIHDLVRRYEPTGKGRSGADYPMLFAGFTLRNSEVGGGAFTLTPEVVVQVCTNGMTRTDEAFRKVHLGEKLASGVVQWSADTHQKTLELITSKTRDVIQSVLSVDFVTRAANEMRVAHQVPVVKPVETIKVVAQGLRYNQQQETDLLNLFITSGDHTALGVGQAVTLMAQAAEDGDAQAAGEGQAFQAIDIAMRAVATV